MSREDHTLRRRREFSAFLAKYQSDVDRMAKDGALWRLSRFFTDGTWSVLSPQTRFRFTARLARCHRFRLSISDRGALITIFDWALVTERHPRIEAALEDLLDSRSASVPGRASAQSPSGPRLSLPELGPMYDWWDPLRFSTYQSAMEHIPRLLEVKVPDLRFSSVRLFSFAGVANRAAHVVAIRPENDALAQRLFDLKAAALVDVLRHHQGAVTVEAEAEHLLRVRHRQRLPIGNLHLLARVLPPDLRSAYRPVFRAFSDHWSAEPSENE